MKRLFHTLIFAILAGCAALIGPQALAQSIAIDRVDSPGTRIDRVRLGHSATALLIDGQVRHRVPVPGPNRGHVRIELLDGDGRVLETVDTGYARLHRRSRLARFHAEVPIDPTQVRTVRIAHHADAR